MSGSSTDSERRLGDARVTLAERLSKRATAAIEAEGRRYLRFAALEAEPHEVEIVLAHAA